MKNNIVLAVCTAVALFFASCSSHRNPKETWNPYKGKHKVHHPQNKGRS